MENQMLQRINYIVMIVGAGGTGGNFAKEFARYAAFYNKDGCGIRTVLIDGDTVEEKNQDRQPYITEDIQQNKSVALTAAIQETFGLKDFYAYPHYIDDGKDLERIYNNFKDNYSPDIFIPVVIGCVDNHRARQCMHAFFEAQPTIFYFDSANEFSVGEIVLAAKVSQQILAPDRCHYFPDVLTDTSQSASELSCGSVNISAPQHLAINLMAANLLLCSTVLLLSDGMIKGGIIYFDKNQLFSRFCAYEPTEKREDSKTATEEPKQAGLATKAACFLYDT